MLAVLLLIGLAVAQFHGGHGKGPHAGMMARGMQHGGPGAHFEHSQVTEDQARDLAQKYAEDYLTGFKVEQVLPSTGMHHTMYSVDLKNADGEIRSLRVTPFGGVMPSGGPGHEAHGG